MARGLSRQAQTIEARLGRVSIDDFVLHLKEMQLLYGHDISWEFQYVARRIKIHVRTDKGKTKRLIANLTSSKMDGSHPDLVSSIQFGGQGRETFFTIETFRKFVIGTIEKL